MIQPDSERKAAQNSTEHPHPQRGRSDPMVRITISGAEALEHDVLCKRGIGYRHVSAVPFLRFGFAERCLAHNQIHL